MSGQAGEVEAMQPVNRDAPRELLSLNEFIYMCVYWCPFVVRLY